MVPWRCRARRGRRHLGRPRLDYIEASDDEILLATSGTKLRKQQLISEIATQLDPDSFVRIHRGYVVNIERSKELSCTQRTAGSQSSRWNAATGKLERVSEVEGV